MIQSIYSNYKRFKYQQQKKIWKSKSNIWKLKTFLNNPWFKKKSSLNEWNRRHQNLLKSTKAVLRDKFIVLNIILWKGKASN